MNWVIFIAVILISSISKSEPKLGGWLGIALTTGILIWGLSVYSDPYSYVTFFGIALSQGMFLLLVTAFYGYDAWLLYKADHLTRETD